MMKTHLPRGLAALGLLAAATACLAHPIPVRDDGETPITLQGIVIGPLTSGDKAEGTLFKAYHLKLAKPMRFDDGADCGPQDKTSLALSQQDMGRDKGKTVTVQAKVFCQINRTGTYHLGDIVVVMR